VSAFAEHHKHPIFFGWNARGRAIRVPTLALALFSDTGVSGPVKQASITFDFRLAPAIAIDLI